MTSASSTRAAVGPPCSAITTRDGGLDIFVTRDGWRGIEGNSLYRQNPDGTYTDVALEAGVAGQADSFTASLADVDNDG